MKLIFPAVPAAVLLICSFAFSGDKLAPVSPPAPVYPLPTAEQMAWHEMEMNAFIHFTTNTFTGLEWGTGAESPALFNPTAFDANQWTKTLKDAGFKGLILTAKHHDGFCLWPSAYTTHSVKSSPWKRGKGDIVKEAAAACKQSGLKFGVYLSPWDRNRADYGSASYIDYYRSQLKELFTGYGPVFEMWFDGANGGSGYYGGTGETRTIDGATYYNWPATLQLVKTIQPRVLFFSDAGPHIRWCGNEQGVGGETNWNTITTDTLYAGKAGIESLLNTGSENGTQWVPAEVNTSIRKGWFYHPEEDAGVKSPEQLFAIYLTSVGRGSTLLLNIPPDKRGLFNPNDIAALQGFKALLRQEFTVNHALHAPVKASSIRGGDKQFAPAHLTDGKKDTYWSTGDNTHTGNLEIGLKKKTTIKYIVLQEYIRLGQRIKSFAVDGWDGNAWQELASATTIGYKRILQLPPYNTDKIRVRIKEAKACPVLSAVEVY